MATRSANDVQMEEATAAAASPSEPRRVNHQSQKSPRAAEEMERGGRRTDIQDETELKRTATPRGQDQRVRPVRLTTRVNPEALVPYLYGERGGRSINTIASTVGCTIDYCALSPDEPERSPQTHGYVMNFLVSAATNEKLEEATRQLRTLVERVQVHIQKKARMSGGVQRAGFGMDRTRGELDERMDLGVDDRHYYEAMEGPLAFDQEPSSGRRHLKAKRRVMMSPTATTSTDPAGVNAAAVTASRDLINDGEERWTISSAPLDTQTDEDWDVPAVPMVYYASHRRQRPRFVDVADMETDDKNSFSTSANKATYLQQQKNEPTSQFVSRRRVRGYPYHSRWPPRHYERSPSHLRNEMRYVVYADESPDGTINQDKRVVGPQQQRYHVAPNPFLHEYDPYSYEDEEGDDGGGGNFSTYTKETNLTSETIAEADTTEFVDAPEHRQPVHHRKHPQASRRSLKRPLNKMRDDMPPPPSIYRQRMPHIYEYPYEEEDEWISDEEDMHANYGYRPQYHHVDMPAVYRRRRFDSVGSVYQWGSPAGHGRRRVVKRRRIPHGGFPLDPEASDSSVYEATYREHVISPRNSQEPQIGEEISAHILPEHANSACETAQVDLESECAKASSTVNQIGNTDVENEEESVLPKTGNAAVERFIAQTDSEEKHNAVQIETSTGLAPLVPVQELPVVDETNKRPDGEVCNIDEMDIYEAVAQRDIISLDTNALSQIDRFQETSVYKHDHSLRREAPSGEMEECITNPPNAAESNDDVNNVVDHDLISSTEKPECVSTGSCVDVISTEVKVNAPFVGAEASAADNFAGARMKSLSFMDKVPSPNINVVTDTIRINNHVIASLERMNRTEAAYVTAKASMIAQEGKYRGLETSSKCRSRLEVLCGIILDLQNRIVSQVCNLDHSRKQDLLNELDGYLESTLTSEQSLQEKVDTLQAGLEHVLCTNDLGADSQLFTNYTNCKKPTNAMEDCASRPHCPVSGTEHEDDRNMNWEDDGWFDESSSNDAVAELENQEDFVAQVSPTESSNLKLEGEYLLVKLEEGDSPGWPHELPSFVWSLLTRVISSDPQSYVMRVTHKRLVEEIAKGNPYYYLHPMGTRKGDVNSVVSSPVRSSPSQTCEFGCMGASALKWERKLVSQISSRMKSFDNVAYSLARSSGGKEVLNRKKMNSIIRKLHLVAMQLHSLISHLYCVKGHTTCNEMNSLPIALNNSHFERKMGIYKSRLKLVVPHKCQIQQQQQQQQNVPIEPTEDLQRDTYEFFPELLLCVDIWGYNYRDGRARRHSNKVLHNDENSSGMFSEAELFPLGFFREVEDYAFDFEHDGNGLLRRICDELLNIVCLWNDFKWTDNLDNVALERVMAFETDVTASIIKILDLHANHLQALWAVRLLDDPERLRNVHFTQLNAYYSDKSQGRVTTRTNPQMHQHGPWESSVPESADHGFSRDDNGDDQLMANEFIEQRVAEEYWKRKVAVLSAHDPIDDAVDTGDIDAKAAQFLSVEAIALWDQPTLLSHLLKWSDVYAMRTDMAALSSVTNHMLKHEMQKHQINGRTNKNARAGTGANGVVDATSTQILAAVNRAQMLIRDAIMSSEKLALHSALNQFPNHVKPLTGTEALAAANAADLSNVLEDSIGCDAAPPSDKEESLNDADSEIDGSDKTSMESAPVPEQPELQDLIQLLVVTRREVQELCSHRPRSARMRDKLQAQSVQLAKQTVEIFRNIRNMYGSQRQ